MGNELELKEMLDFIYSYNVNSNRNNILLNQTVIAENYLKRLKTLDKNGYEKIIKDIENKLKIIINKNTERISKSNNASKNLVTGNLTDYIINKIKFERLTDPKLIARYAYIELARNLYYDISYTKVSYEQKQIIVNTPIDVKNAKLFSYVVCSQWSELYSYILNCFGIENKIMRIPGQDHRWVEINLHNGEIIIADATDYIGNSIDFSNAKSISETTGFYILPQRFSGLKLGDVLKSNDLFNQKNRKFDDPKELLKYLEDTRKFLHNIKIPNNMDGYEIYAYYHKFIKPLPLQVRGNIAMKTVYADLFSYKQKTLKRKYFQAPSDYIKYLEELVYDRYYEYLNKSEQNNILEKIKQGLINSEEISNLILQEEIKVAELNRRLNPYYAINELIYYRSIIDPNLEDYYEYYEPGIGKRLIKSTEDAFNFKKSNKIG